jgi:hypothetical protein
MGIDHVTEEMRAVIISCIRSCYVVQALSAIKVTFSGSRGKLIIFESKMVNYFIK